MITVLYTLCLDITDLEETEKPDWPRLVSQKLQSTFNVNFLEESLDNGPVTGGWGLGGSQQESH